MAMKTKQKKETTYKKIVTRLLSGIRGIAVSIVISILAISTTKAIAEAENYSYVCVGVEGAEDIEGEFTQAAQPASGKFINLHAVANTPCRIFAIALRKKDGLLAHGWRPEVSSLNEWEEAKLPKAPGAWKWPQAEAAFYIHVLIFDLKSKELSLLEELLSAMEKTGQDPQTHSLQVKRLSELINIWSGGEMRLASDIKTEYAGLGGVERGQESASFQWRQFAKKVIFTRNQPGILTYVWTPK